SFVKRIGDKSTALIARLEHIWAAANRILLRKICVGRGFQTVRHDFEVHERQRIQNTLVQTEADVQAISFTSSSRAIAHALSPFRVATFPIGAAKKIDCVTYVGTRDQ